jgi:hypothetical protein
MLIVVTIIRNKCFGLVGLGQKRLEGSTVVGRNAEATNAVVANFHGTSLCDLGIVTCTTV